MYTKLTSRLGRDIVSRSLILFIRDVSSHAYFPALHGCKAFCASGNNLGGANKLKRLCKSHSPSTPHRPDTSRAKRATEAWVTTALRYISVHILYDLLSTLIPVVTILQQPTFQPTRTNHEAVWPDSGTSVSERTILTSVLDS
jgi:hypothetical protein